MATLRKCIDFVAETLSTKVRGVVNTEVSNKWGSLTLLPGIMQPKTFFKRKTKKEKKCWAVSQASHSFGSDGSVQWLPESQVDGLSTGYFRQVAQTSNVSCSFASVVICRGRGRRHMEICLLTCLFLFSNVLSFLCSFSLWAAYYLGGHQEEVYVQGSSS